MFEDRIYYEDQTGWSPDDFHGLWRYLSRLVTYVGPTPHDLAHPESRSARIQAKRTGTRDDEIAAMDLERMSEETRYLLKHLLIHQQRADLAFERFPNLRPLKDVGELGHPLYLDRDPKYVYEYYTGVGIYL